MAEIVRRLRSLVRWFPALAAGMLAAGAFAGAPPSAAVAALGRFDAARRAEQFAVVDRVSTELWRSKKRARVVRSVRGHALGESVPVLELTDRDGDRRAEQFTYCRAGEGGCNGSEEFGFFWDLDGDGRVDWLVFNIGPGFTRGFGQMVWMTTHYVDTNGDGRIDALVWNAIDTDGDQFPDPGFSAWLWDRDFDGRIDDGEIVGADGARPLEERDGAFVVPRAFGLEADAPPRRGDALPTRWNEALREITQASAK